MNNYEISIIVIMLFLE